MKHDSSPVGLTLSASPQWRRVDDVSGQRVDSYSVVLTILADAALTPNTTFAAINLIGTPTSTQNAGVWQQEAPVPAQ